MVRCQCCGAELPEDPAQVDLRFGLPDVARSVAYEELPDGTLLAGELFTPCRLQVDLSGGLSVVFGTWLRVADSTLANDIAPFDLLGAPVTTAMRRGLPWVTGSPDPRVVEVLTGSWDRNAVLSQFAMALPVTIQESVSDEWRLERTAGLAARVTDGVLQFAGPGRTVHVEQLVDEAVRAPEEFLGDLIASAPAVPADQVSTVSVGDGVRYVFWQVAVVDGREQYELYGFVVRAGAALAVSCFHDDPDDHTWALHVFTSATYLG